MQSKGLAGYNITIKDALKHGGFYGKDGTWNSLLRIDGKILRGRVETLIIKKDQQQVFMHIKNYNKGLYRVPGGSTMNGVANIIQAENEIHEEARIIIKNIVNTGITYTRLYKKPMNLSLQSEVLDWEGNYNELYVAEYDGIYTGKILKRDIDEDMYEYGKFYDLSYVYPILTVPHKQLIDSIFEKIKTSEISESFILLQESDNNVHYYPYYTPLEMNKLGVFNETVNRYSDIEDEAIDWYHEYTDLLRNEDSSNWYKELQLRYSNYTKESTLENKQLVLHLGWNPEVPVTLENVLTASNRTEIKIKNEGIKEEAIDESMIFDKKDIVLNMDKWESDKSNILFITGLSGSGKTTLSSEIASEYKAKIIQLDYFQNYYILSTSDFKFNADEVITINYIERYMKLHPEVKFKSNKFSSIKLDSFKQYFVPFFKWLVLELESDTKNKYVVEGMHILLFIRYKDISNYPLYCINASLTKSLIRHWIRDEWNTKDIISHGYKDILYFKKWDDSYETFKGNIQESVSNKKPIVDVAIKAFKELGCDKANMDKATRVKFREEAIYGFHACIAGLGNEGLESKCTKVNKIIKPMGYKVQADNYGTAFIMRTGHRTYRGE